MISFKLSDILAKKIVIHFFNENMIEQKRVKINKKSINAHYKFVDTDYFLDECAVYIDKNRKDNIDFQLGTNLPLFKVPANTKFKYSGAKITTLFSAKVLKSVFGGSGFSWIEFLFGIGIGTGISAMIVMFLMAYGKIIFRY